MAHQGRIIQPDVPRRHLVISPESHALLAAHVLPGKVLSAPVKRFRDGSVVIDVDQEVYDSLRLIDENPDRAIRILCSGGVGHS